MLDRVLATQRCAFVVCIASLGENQRNAVDEYPDQIVK